MCLGANLCSHQCSPHFFEFLQQIVFLSFHIVPYGLTLKYQLGPTNPLQLIEPVTLQLSYLQLQVSSIPSYHITVFPKDLHLCKLVQKISGIKPMSTGPLQLIASISNLALIRLLSNLLSLFEKRSEICISTQRKLVQIKGILRYTVF